MKEEYETPVINLFFAIHKFRLYIQLLVKDVHFSVDNNVIAYSQLWNALARSLKIFLLHSNLKGYFKISHYRESLNMKISSQVE